MSGRGRAAAVFALLLAALLALPASAGAHAALLRTVPEASGTINGAPAQVSLTYSEAVEPRFAIVSVTDAAGRRVVNGNPHRSASDPDTLQVGLERVPKGWYLVYWRVISADGHPVRGAFTFAVGPNPGPAPQFAIPSLQETAATPGLVIARWAAFLSMMAALGLLLFRLTLARRIARAQPDFRLRGLNVAVLASLLVALVAVPIYVLASTAEFALRSIFDVGALLPLVRASAFGRGWLTLELVLALLALASAVALWLDRPERDRRSVAELLATTGVAAAGAALLLVPGLAGHAAQESPRGTSLVLDWAHLLAGSVWIGGLIGLCVTAFALRPEARADGLALVVPRFSNLAFGSVALLIASGTLQAILRLPTLASLFDTGYGQALVVKIGLLLAALVLGAVNLLRSRPRLSAGRPGAVGLLRRLVGGEVVLLVCAVFVAGVLSSLPPPSKALGAVGKADANVGPGAVLRTVTHGPYKLTLRIAPNRAAVPNVFDVQITKGGAPVNGAEVTARFDMLDMEMQQQEYTLPQRSPSFYSRSAPSLVMVGHWGLSFTVTPPGASPFDVVVLDRAEG